jgi:nucleoside-diphosphate-sugar epimerase
LDVRGAFNLAAEPVLDSELLAQLFVAKKVATQPGTLRTLAELSFRLHLQPAEPGWIDLCFKSPLLDCARARDELDWQATRSAPEALMELLQGLRSGAGFRTPPLESDVQRSLTRGRWGRLRAS